MRRIASLGWVNDVTSRGRNGLCSWVVSVNDPDAAEGHLLRKVLADENLTVTDFRRNEYELEDFFIKIVEGNGHDNQE